MGQKVHPYGLRVGIIKNWKTRWFARKDSFHSTLIEDLKLKQYVKSKLAGGAIAKIETERTGERGAPPRSEERVSLGIKGKDHEDGGFLIVSLAEGESAAQAGLEVGDVIIRLGDTAIDGRMALVEAMAS